MSCPEVITGDVQLTNENYSQIQASVNSGKNLWRLSPVRTAQVIGTENLGLRTNDVYTFVEQYTDSGIPHAVVRVKHKTCTYLIEMIQPRTQGAKGIWVVQTVTEL